MNDCILFDIKKMLGFEPVPMEEFDTEIIIDIDSAFSVLNQIGVGPSKPFSILSDPYNKTWEDFFEDSTNAIELVKTYIFMKVKLMFDPPQSSITVDVYRQQISEFENRLNIMYDKG